MPMEEKGKQVKEATTVTLHVGASASTSAQLALHGKQIGNSSRKIDAN